MNNIEKINFKNILSVDIPIPGDVHFFYIQVRRNKKNLF